VTFEKALECITNLINFENDTTPTFRASMEKPQTLAKVNYFTPKRDDEENMRPPFREDDFSVRASENITSPTIKTSSFVSKVE
jgi:hypothetical protein